MSGNQNAFQNAMNLGHSAAWDQEWEQAAIYYRMAIDEFPENAIALNNLGLALLELQNYTESLECYQRAAISSPGDVVPVQKIADIYELLGDQNNATNALMEVAELHARNKNVEQTIQTWIHVTALDPMHLAAHTRLAMVYERLGRNNQAIGEFIAIAGILQSQGNVQKAIQTLKHALQVVPDSKDASLALSMVMSGKALAINERTKDEAGPVFMSKTRADTQPSAHEHRIKLDPVEEAKQKSLTMLAELLFEKEETNDPQSRKNLSTLLNENEVVEQAQIDPVAVNLHLSKAIDLHAQGDDVQAIIELKSAMDARMDIPAAHFLLGYLQAANNDPQSAIQNLQKSAQDEILGLGSHLLNAQTYFNMDALKDAAIAYLGALRIADAQSVPVDQSEELAQLYDPLIETCALESDETLLKRTCENISKLLIRTDWREQVQQARSQLPPQPAGAAPVPIAGMLTEATNSQLVESLAKVNQLMQANKPLSAMDEAFYALKIAPSYLPLHVCIGDLLVQEGHIPEAILKYTITARTFNIRGDVSHAINLYRRISELDPMNLDARNSLIEIMIARGKNQQTMDEFFKLGETFYNMADLPLARKTYSRAYRFAQQVNVNRETKLKLMHRLADIDIQSLDWRNAIRVFEQIRLLDPDDIKARDNLFSLNLRLGQLNQAMTELDNYLNHLLSNHRSGEALEYINTKILENQNQPALYRRLAELYRLLNRKEEAISQLEIAKEMFLQAGNRSAAIESVMAILALNPASPIPYQKMLVELQTQG